LPKSNDVTEYASYRCAGRPSHFPRTGRLLSPQPNGLRDATTVAAAVTLDKGKLGEPSFSVTFQEKTREHEVGEPAHTTPKEVDASSVANAAERRSGRFGPISRDR
jgi:hypothetical protein